jgi:hypothetical protein
VSFQQFGEAGNLETLQEQIIDDQMRRRYAKDLLHLLQNDWNVQCVEKGASFGRLMEFVLRRNVHVHNRGIVDQRYVEANYNLSS